MLINKNTFNRIQKNKNYEFFLQEILRENLVLF